MKSFRSFNLFLFLGGLAAAQTPPASSAPTPEDEPLNLEALIVTGSPFARAQDEIVPPTTVLGGRQLARKLQPTLGETLAGEPGVSSSWFGPGASRPVIRGLGGDRVRVLTGGVGMIDASVVSPDHAVSLEPLLIDRIEVVRGPATLLYGGAAIGGVINVLDGRIPETAAPSPLGGRLELRGATGSDELAGAGLLTGRAGAFTWRLDGFRRETDDLRIPGFAETEALRESEAHEAEAAGRAAETPAYGRLPNSAVTSSGAAFGLSWLGENGHLGFAYSGFDSFYGVPGHEHHHEEEAAVPAGDEGVKLDLRQRRLDAHGEWLSATGLLRAAKLQFGAADYEHVELEDGVIGTVFTNEGFEGRLELLHGKIGPLEGALGLQLSRSDFAAVGDEAFLPPSVTDNHALFLFEEAVGERVTWQFGARVERQKITPDSGRGLSARSHTGTSLSAGLVWPVSADYAVALSFTRNERAPNAQELFAEGPHAGTGAYETGDPALGLERSTGLDLSLRRRRGAVTGAVSLFLNDFSGYVFEQDTGLVDPDGGLTIFRFVQRDARFYGGEVEVVVHLHESKAHQADLRFTGDYVRADNRTDGQALPRTTPARGGVAFDWRGPRFSFNAGLQHVDRMTRLAPRETPTDDHTLIHLGATWQLALGRTKAELFAQAANLGNRTARNHNSFLKDIAPLPGRSVALGLRMHF